MSPHCPAESSSPAQCSGCRGPAGFGDLGLLWAYRTPRCGFRVTRRGCVARSVTQQALACRLLPTLCAWAGLVCESHPYRMIGVSVASAARVVRAGLACLAIGLRPLGRVTRRAQKCLIGKRCHGAGRVRVCGSQAAQPRHRRGLRVTEPYKRRDWKRLGQKALTRARCNRHLPFAFRLPSMRLRGDRHIAACAPPPPPIRLEHPASHLCVARVRVVGCGVGDHRRPHHIAHSRP